VSLNNADFTNDGVQFTYQSDANVTSLSPANIPECTFRIQLVVFL